MTKLNYNWIGNPKFNQMIKWECFRFGNEIYIHQKPPISWWFYLLCVCYKNEPPQKKSIKPLNPYEKHIKKQFNSLTLSIIRENRSTEG